MRFVAKFLNSDDWSKHFVLNHLIVLLEIGNNGGSEVITRAVNYLSAGHHSRVARSSVEKSLYASQLICVIYRTIKDIFGRPTSSNIIFCLLGQQSNEVIVSRCFYHHASCSGAILTCVEISSDSNCFGSCFKIGISKYNNGCFATEFKVNFLHIS